MPFPNLEESGTDPTRLSDNLSHWLNVAYLSVVGTGDLQNEEELSLSDVTEEGKTQLLGQKILSLSEPATTEEIGLLLQKQFGSVIKFSSNEYFLEAITEGLLYFSVSEKCSYREVFVQAILTMEASQQEYFMKLIKYFKSQDISYEVEEAEFDESTEFDDTETNICLECVAKEETILELKKRLSEEELRDDEDSDVESKEEKSTTQKDAESKVAELTDSLSNLSEEIDVMNQRLLDSDMLVVEKDKLISKLQKDLKDNTKKSAETVALNIKLEGDLRIALANLETAESTVERVYMIDAQLENLRKTAYGHNQTLDQLRGEKESHTNTFAKLVKVEKELATAQQICSELEDFKTACENQFEEIERLKYSLQESEDEIFRLRNDKHRMEIENKDHIFRHQVLEEELSLVNDMLHNLESAGGVGVAVHELNPVLMTELKYLRNETKELREKLARSSIEKFEELQKDLADEKLLAAALHAKWMAMKSAHDELKQKLESARGFSGSQLVDENELRDIRRGYEVELIQLRGKLHDAEIKVQTLLVKQAGANEAMSGEAAKKYQYEIVDLKSQLNDANNKINDLNETIFLKETILNSSKEEGLIATRRAHEIEINGLKASVVEAQSRVNDLTVANKVQEAVLNGSIAEHSEARKKLESEIASMRAVIQESQSKINELSIINRVQESALASNQEDIANVKTQYDIETNHLKAAYSEAKIKIAELNEALKALTAAKAFNEDDVRSRKILEEEIASLKVVLHESQVKTNELLVSNKVLDSALSVSKDDHSKHKELSSQEINSLKVALSAAQIKLNELSVSNKVNENSSKLHEDTALRLRNELADCKKQYELELRSTKKALQDAQTKIHELIQDEISHETQTKKSGGDPDLVPAIKGHYENEISHLKMSLETAQEKINDLTVIIKVQEHALTNAKEELAIAKHQHEVDISQSKFTVEVHQNKIKVLEDSIRRQEDSLKGSLNFQGESDANTTASQDASRRYFEYEASRLRATLADAENRVEQLTLTAIEKAKAFEEMSLQCKIQENIISNCNNSLFEVKRHGDEEILSLKALLSSTQSSLNEALVNNKVQENLLADYRVDIEFSRNNFQSEISLLRQRLSDAATNAEELMKVNRRLELEKNSTHFDAELKRVKDALGESHIQEESLRRQVVQLLAQSVDLRAEIESKNDSMNELKSTAQSVSLHDYTKLRDEMRSFRVQYNELLVQNTVNEKLLAASNEEVEKVRASSDLEIARLTAELQDAVAQRTLLTEALSAEKSVGLSAQEALVACNAKVEELALANSKLSPEFYESKLDADILRDTHDRIEAQHFKAHHRKTVHDGNADVPRHFRRGSKSMSKTDDGEEDDDDFGTLPIYDFQVVQLQSSLSESKEKADKLDKELEANEKLITELNCHKKILESLVETSKENLSAANLRATIEISSLKAEVVEAQQALLDLTVKFHVQEEQNKNLSREVSVTSVELASSREAVAMLEEANRTALATVTILEETIKALKQELEELKAARPQLSAAALDSNLQTQEQEQNQQSELQLYNLETSLQESKLKNVELTTSLQLQEEVIEGLRADRVSEIESLTAELADHRSKITDLTAARILLEQELSRAKDELLVMSKKVDDSAHDKHRTEVEDREKLAVLKVKLQLAESESADSKQEISALQEKFFALEHESLETKAALETTLVNLDESQKVRAKLVKQHEEDVQEMTKRHEEELQNNAFTVRDHVKAKVETYLNELLEERDALREELEAAQAQLQAVKDAAPDEVHLLALRSESEQAHRDLERANTKVGELSQSLHIIMEEMQESVAAKKQLENGLSSCNESLLESKKQVQTLSNEAVVVETQLAAYKKELESLKKAHDAFVKDRADNELQLIKQYNIEMQNEAKAIRELDQAKKAFDAESQLLKDRLRDSLAEAKESSERIKAVEYELRSFKDEHSTLKVEIQTVKTSLVEAQVRYTEAQKTLSIRQDELSSFQKELDAIRQQKILLEMQHKAELENLTTSVREQIHAKVGEYVKNVEDECEALNVKLRAANSEIDRLSKAATATSNSVTPVSPTPKMTMDTVNVSAKIADPDQEALQVGLLLSKQEAEHGTNMFDSLRPQDNSVIQAYMGQGFSKEEAILMIFEQKYGKDPSSHTQIMSMVS